MFVYKQNVDKHNKAQISKNIRTFIPGAVSCTLAGRGWCKITLNRKLKGLDLC